jgi:NAD(P)-dependent dehydrogenase (short-subunit alcohol dehydrogenase family)
MVIDSLPSWFPGDAITVLMLLREDLLSDRVLALAGPAPDAVTKALVSLGARAEALPGGGADDAELEGWARDRAPLHGLLYDATPAFGEGGEEALRAAVDGAWAAVRAVAVGALIPAASDVARKIVLVAPPVVAGPFARAAAAALENLARTLSVEWARYGITAVAVVPGTATTPGELAELVCFLVSPAGDYFSGCRIDLGLVGLGQSR